MRELFLGTDWTNVGILGIVVSLFGIVSGAIALFISFSVRRISRLAYKHNEIEIINLFFSNERDPQLIKARRAVHNLPNEYDPREINEERGELIAALITTYNQYGLLVEKKKLPFEIFSEGATGITIVTHYKKLLPYIKLRRDTDNEMYADYFETLARRIAKKRNLTLESPVIVADEPNK